MKQSDIAALILVIAFSLLGSWLIMGALIPEPTPQESEVELVDPISSEFPDPHPATFADGFLNPTELIEIDKADNQQPFSGQ